MDGPANVKSLESIQNIKTAMCSFADEMFQVQTALMQEIHRMFDWVENDRPQYWRQRVRNGFDRVAETRTKLSICKNRKVGDHRPSCYEERKDFERAKRDLQIAQEKVELVRRWGIKLRQEFEVFQGQYSSLKSHVEVELPRSIALLTRILNSLEAYAEMSLETEARPEGTSRAVTGTDDEETQDT